MLRTYQQTLESMWRSSEYNNAGLVTDILDCVYFTISVARELNHSLYKDLRKIQHNLERHPWWISAVQDLYGISSYFKKSFSYSEMLFNSFHIARMGKDRFNSIVVNLKDRIDSLINKVRTLELNELIPPDLSKELFTLAKRTNDYYAEIIFKSRKIS